MKKISDGLYFLEVALGRNGCFGRLATLWRTAARTQCHCQQTTRREVERLGHRLFGLFPEQTSGIEIHGAYLSTPETMTLMRKILVGIDRTVLTTLGATRGTAWPPQ